MNKLEHDLLTDKYTSVFHEAKEDMKYNAPHRFEVYNTHNAQLLQTIRFQEGPINECGINGVCNEDLIAMVITRLEHFQQTKFSCRENAVAITKLEEALMWLGKRTTGRAKRGVEGTHVK